ncbi:MAG TPA: hypothetical protein VKM72_29030 [Thermoanaerobaculia bacterium]|nr:hypothetical protein [Thermoanaerobaculia bacterium]
MRTYPSPTVVIGLGRFGLALLERLGDDWMSLRQSGGEADASLENLRLIWVHPQDPQASAWRRQEWDARALARTMGEGDFPSLALDLVILRTLGLIRYRDGVYQVAVPRDAGVVDTKALQPAGAAGGVPIPEGRVQRRRYFEWRTLSPDPIVAVERLHRLAERHNDLDLFITPILNRVRQGHSPRVLLAIIGRCQALAEGRDPSPWEWLRDRLKREEGPGPILRLTEDPGWVEQQKRRSADLEGFVPEPLPGWTDWLRTPQSADLALTIPPPFLPQASDPVAPFDPFRFLEVDWETTGWASQAGSPVQFDPVPAGPFRVGLFDHDAGDRFPRIGDLLQLRLEKLAEHTYRGLLRLWADLQRDRVEDLDPNQQHHAHQEQMDAALRQSLEILGEILVRPLVVAGSGNESDAGPAAETLPLPAEPSPFLSTLHIDEKGRSDDVLVDRLTALGLEPLEGDGEDAHPLLRRVGLDLPPEGARGESAGEGRSEGLLDLRSVLNEETRRLYSFSLLTRYRDFPTRRPPRLTIYVVGDMSDSFTRASFRDVLREIHAELLRSFSPIFEFYREGFNRCLSVVPILWTPHPADPFGGAAPAENRSEEAVIIDAVHGIRRWVESVLPANRRRVSQIFVNSRVTDNAVLNLQDAVRQTRDFISFQARNDISRDEWLQRTATGPGGNDLFSSFACYEIDFPAERCREYLGNRLARSCLAQILRGKVIAPRELSVEGVAPPDQEGLLKEGTEGIHRLTREAAGQMEQTVAGRATIERETPSRLLQRAFDKEFERSLLREIQAKWGELTRARGRMDELVDTLRRETSELLPAALASVKEQGDRLIGEHASGGGLTAAQAGFEQLRAATRDELQRREQARRACEDLCRKHRIPDTGPVRAAREAVAAAAERKPDLPPLHFGLVLIGLLSLVLGAPIAQSVAYLLGSLGPSALFGRFDGLFGGGLLTLLAAILLFKFLDLRVQAVRQAVERLAREARLLFYGTGEPPEREARASVRSFFETRLRLTGALAIRGFTLRIFERAVADRNLAHRIRRSLDIQSHRLAQGAEDLGVRPAGIEADGLQPRDDLRHLFETRAGDQVDQLIHPERLQEYFERQMGREESLTGVVPELIHQSGGLGDWRKEACLADREKIMVFCRRQFDSIVTTPIAEQEMFADEVEARLVRFVASRFSNIGFGAKFVGYEGLDPDGIHVPACASLVLDGRMLPVWHRARRRPGAPPTTETMEVLTVQVRPNAAYMMSLVQGIRAHSVRNLRRFESFHDRVRMPDDRTFPLAQEQHGAAAAVINPLTGHAALGEQLRARIERIAQDQMTQGRHALEAGHE